MPDVAGCLIMHYRFWRPLRTCVVVAGGGWWQMRDHAEGDSVGVRGKADVLHVRTLLQAAGIDSLDTPCTSSSSTS